MSGERVEFRIAVKPSPETNDHEVCLLGDGKDLIKHFAGKMIGLDPDTVLVEPCQLRAEPTAHTALIGRCSCGEIGCSRVEVEIQGDGEVVTWKQAGAPQIQFLAGQYNAEIDRALRDFSWETPNRTAARLISKEVDRNLLARRGFRLSWASGRCRKGVMTAALLGPAPHQVLVNLPWDGKDVGSIVNEFKVLLSAPPETWPNEEL
jgi:hypothetical protein